MRNYLTTMSASAVRTHYASGAWRTDTLLDQVVQNADRHPDRPALIDSRLSLTHREVVRAVAGVAGRLSRKGVEPGTPVLVQLPNSVAYAVTSIALSALGAVIVPLSHSLLSAEINAVAARVSARKLICSERSARRLQDSGDSLVELIVDSEILEAASDHETHWSIEDSASDPDAVLDLMFTSGTTGQPKGIINSTNTKFSAIRPFVDQLGLGFEDAWLVVPPMSHNAGWLYSFAPALLTAAPVVFQETFDAEGTVRLLRDFDIKAVFFTPTHATDVLEVVRSGIAPPSVLKYVLMGGAVTPTSTRIAVRSELGAQVVTLYGSTENQAATFTPPNAPPEFADDSVGTACPGTEVAIFAEDRRTIVGTGEIGHIGTRGAGTFLGYFDNQAATDSAFNADGWFFAGDLGSLDEHARVHVTGRDKELIIRGGFNIVPEDVEAALKDFPGSPDFAAVGLPDERLGERVCLVVHGDPQIDLTAVLSYLEAAGVGKKLWPEALLHVDEFPLTDLGKVKRSILRVAAVEALTSGSLELVPTRAATGDGQREGR